MKIINISGEIGWEVTPDKIREQLKSANGADIDVHIASPGGFVFDGIEIYNMIRDYKRDNPKAQATVTIKGLAASMASYLAMNSVFDIVAAEDNAVFMIHNASGGVFGDYRDAEKMAEILKGITDLLGSAYMKKTGKSKKEIQQLMDDESWYFGSEMKDAGFVDEIVPSTEPIEKPAALAQAKLRFSEVSAKMNEKKIDINKMAATLKELTFLKPAQTPAVDAGKNNLEVLPMNLNEFLAQDPAAKIEYDNKLIEKFEAGKIELQTRMTAASKYLQPDSTYPAPIKAIAIDVLKGTKSVEALETTVAAFDALKAATESEAAKKEQPKETSGQESEALSPNGEIKTTADVMAQIRRDKIALGLEV